MAAGAEAQLSRYVFNRQLCAAEQNFGPFHPGIFHIIPDGEAGFLFELLRQIVHGISRPLRQHLRCKLLTQMHFDIVTALLDFSAILWVGPVVMDSAYKIIIHGHGKGLKIGGVFDRFHLSPKP